MVLAQPGRCTTNAVRSSVRSTIEPVADHAGGCTQACSLLSVSLNSVLRQRSHALRHYCLPPSRLQRLSSTPSERAPSRVCPIQLRRRSTTTATASRSMTARPSNCGHERKFQLPPKLVRTPLTLCFHQRLRA